MAVLFFLQEACFLLDTFTRTNEVWKFTSKMMSPTPQQSSYSSNEVRQWQTEIEDQVSKARDRAVSARMEQYLERR